ncbi:MULTISPECIES: rhamnulose-1-phosphate aldolase [unclassified Niallia]|uniref:rhamnulose-1-phosphate aldolase n=2 Tax=Bacillati TaxID=1783272 RepID=UPI001EDBB160|nr:MULTISPECIES: rhamnulose-1-phosphate aldolase [unclassified Niallia]MDL0437346.1 rhamnulose-1-phosphate aldolase [Niallia sp. SS-2023]UPO86051.1 rhamnulose-1-phosphate aldolase [Niallia sp. Man26]
MPTKVQKKNLEDAPFLKEMYNAAFNMWRLGWDERNGGNISYLLKEEEVKEYLDASKVVRTIPIPTSVEELEGKFFIVTGSGKYFKNAKEDPCNTFGIIKVGERGQSIDLLWGLEDGTLPTSELPAHFKSHTERLKVDSEHRVIMHNHATNIIAMTFTHELDEAMFTKTLWQMCTECIVVFPDGIGIVPWMIPGTAEIGLQTAQKMKEHRLVIWPHHGIFGAGTTIDETFGLIETAEKAAQIYTAIGDPARIKQTITDRELADLAKAFHVTPRPGIIIA